MGTNNILVHLLQKDGNILVSYFSKTLFPPFTILVLRYFHLAEPYLFAVIVITVLFLLTSAILRLWLTYKESMKHHAFLEITPLSNTIQSSFTTTQLFNAIHGLARQRPWLYRLLRVNKQYSFEIVSTKNDGIRYVMRLPAEDSDIIKKNLIAYLPGIKITEDRKSVV